MHEVHRAMIIYPAIDLRRGRCVRLRQGDPNAETVFGDDPAAMARFWVSQGAQWLHVVNLDGALGATQNQLNALHRPQNILIQHPGMTSPETPAEELRRELPINLQRLREIRAAVSAPIQFGGGLRTLEDIQLALELGADRVVLGTVAVADPGMVTEALRVGAPTASSSASTRARARWPPTAGRRPAPSMPWSWATAWPLLAWSGWSTPTSAATAC
jgi:phosphoribosylformimino-5-aminoimidazole carboxamide ribotide isomerase